MQSPVRAYRSAPQDCCRPKEEDQTKFLLRSPSSCREDCAAVGAPEIDGSTHSKYVVSACSETAESVGGGQFVECRHC